MQEGKQGWELEARLSLGYLTRDTVLKTNKIFKDANKSEIPKDHTDLYRLLKWNSESLTERTVRGYENAFLAVVSG